MNQHPKNEIRIEMIKEIEDFHAGEDLQMQVWGGTEREVVPWDLMIALNYSGGAVFGAWDQSKLVGLAVSFMACHNGINCHYSHIVGLLPEYRKSSIGFELKLAQRNFVLSQRLSLIAWTFDPLESVNAHFNFGKLGVISSCYLLNHYGFSPEALNAGLPTDRLLVEWHLQAPHVLALVEGKRHGPERAVNEEKDLPYLVKLNKDGAPESRADSTSFLHNAYIIEIPMDIQKLKADDPALALSWRLSLRKAFMEAFANEYVVDNFFKPVDSKPGHYLLTKKPRVDSRLISPGT
jgi:predicted GNAT superfamily acetyltransferase